MRKKYYITSVSSPIIRSMFKTEQSEDRNSECDRAMKRNDLITSLDSASDYYKREGSAVNAP